MEFKDYDKYLGVLIDSHLTWKHHIDYIVAKISKTVGVIANIRRFVPADILLKIYGSIIFPYLQYGIAFWGQAAETHMNKILLLQKRVLRFIYGKEYHTHSVPLILANILPVNMLYIKKVACLMRDLSSGSLPPNITKLFIRSCETHSYNTRFSYAGNFYVNKSRLNQQLLSFTRFGPRLWNAFPDSIRSRPKRSFNKEIHSRLINILR